MKFFTFKIFFDNAIDTCLKKFVYRTLIVIKNYLLSINCLSHSTIRRKEIIQIPNHEMDSDETCDNY